MYIPMVLKESCCDRYRVYFKNCEVLVYPTVFYVETWFKDGTKVPAFPNKTLDVFKTAENLGYGNDNNRMTVEHEILHTILCENVDLEYSPTLWSVAHSHNHNQVDGCISVQQQWEEEGLVLAFQKYLNLQVIDYDLKNYMDKNNISLDQLKVLAETSYRVFDAIGIRRNLK